MNGVIGIIDRETNIMFDNILGTKIYQKLGKIATSKCTFSNAAERLKWSWIYGLSG